MPEQTPQFAHFEYVGPEAEKFLQGQVTVHVSRLPPDVYQATAICDLKGRVHFGLWLRRHSAEHIELVITQDLATELQQHIKKYGAFSKAKLDTAKPIYPAIIADAASFSEDPDQAVSLVQWQRQAILHGQAWICQATSHLFQPQELRLHQRSGVDYDKGCYLGQEIIARLWFKAKPKHWLHLVQGQGAQPNIGEQLGKDLQIINAIPDREGWLALVCAKPEAIDALGLSLLKLPEGLNGDVARPQ